jgi:hypothetical protein
MMGRPLTKQIKVNKKERERPTLHAEKSINQLSRLGFQLPHSRNNHYDVP